MALYINKKKKFEQSHIGVSPNIYVVVISYMIFGIWSSTDLFERWYLVSNNGTKGEDDLQKLIYNYNIYQNRKEIILNKDLCGVFLELQAKKTNNYWSMEQNKLKMVFRSTVVDVESRWSAEHF